MTGRFSGAWGGVRAVAADDFGARVYREIEDRQDGGCHLFRRTVATLMLENGADTRIIQEMLGRARLSTTELYTRVCINLLKQVYLATHLGASERAELKATLDAEGEEEDV